MNPTTLVTCYVNPDLDGVASAVAYAEFLCKERNWAEAGIIGEMHTEAKYVFDRFNLPPPLLIKDSTNYDQIILVDASDLNGLEGKIIPEKVIEVIDHRKIHEADKFFNAKVQIELVGAAATLIAEKFIKSNIEISRPAAILLYAAIVSNTLNFRNLTTDERDKKMAKWLNKTADLPEYFWKELFIAKSDLSGSKLVERINGDFAWFVIGNKKIGIAQIEIIGAEKLIEDRKLEIILALDKIKAEMQLDYIFLNTIELEKVKNYFVTDDLPTQALLEKLLKVKFNGYVAQSSNIIMRKQITPLLNNEFGFNHK